MCKRIFKFEVQLSSYWQNIKFSRYCPKFHIFAKIVIFKYICNFFYQLLHPYKFHGRDMSGILFFIFASCEPLSVKEQLIYSWDKITGTRGLVHTNPLALAHLFLFFVLFCLCFCFCLCVCLCVCLFVCLFAYLFVNRLALLCHIESSALKYYLIHILQFLVIKFW